MNGSQQTDASATRGTPDGPDGPALRVRGLRKSYRGVPAVHGIDLTVGRGEIFALLGPNGAGKTTTVEILEGYRSRDGGEAEVLGTDPAHPTRDWRARLGIVLQTCQIESELTVEESLAMVAGYYPRPRSVGEVLDLVGLTDQRRRRAGKLSGGQQRRLDVGLALIGNPELIFLDEPTTGFDPAARHRFWEVIRALRTGGATIVLTTHYLDEAQALADRVAILADGRIVAEGPPDTLGGDAFAATRISFRLPRRAPAVRLPDITGLTAEPDHGAVHIDSDRPVHTLKQLLGWSEAQHVDLDDLTVTRPSLEEIYLELTETAS